MFEKNFNFLKFEQKLSSCLIKIKREFLIISNRKKTIIE